MPKFALGSDRAFQLVRTVRRTVAIIALFSAWFCANGALWNCVQVVAWGQMMHDYSRIMPLDKAIEKTFDGSAPCELCEVVKTAQQQKPVQQIERSSEKVLLAMPVATAVVLQRPEFTWPGAVNRQGLERTELVPVPPPRV